MSFSSKKQPDFYCNKKSFKCHLLLVAVMAFFLLISVSVYASSGEGEAPKGWVKTDTYRVMNFVVLAAGLVLILRKPVSDALSSRIEEIQNNLDELEAKRKDAEIELAGYAKKLTELDKESEKIIQEYIQQGNDSKAKILEEAQNAVKKIEEQARKNIANEFKRARNRIKGDILEKAIARAEELIKSRINEEDQERLVDEYLKKVVA